MVELQHSNRTLLEYASGYAQELNSYGARIAWLPLIYLKLYMIALHNEVDDSAFSTKSSVSPTVKTLVHEENR